MLMLVNLSYILLHTTYAKILKKAACLFEKNLIVEKYQVEKFNEVWNDAFHNIKIYKEWK